MRVDGVRPRTARTHDAKCPAPPSRRSSRSTEVMTTCRSPRRATVAASRSGSAGSRGSGRPWATSQNGQRRVQSSPITMNVAVPCEKHSPRFGHDASSHTVTRRCSRRRPLSLVTSGPTGARTRIHGGFRGSGPSTGMTLTGLRAVLLAPDWAVGCVDVDMDASMPALRPPVRPRRAR